MIKSALDARNMQNIIFHKPEFKSEFSGVLISPNDWTNLELMSKFLETPAKISTFLGGDNGYCTISKAIIAKNLFSLWASFFDETDSTIQVAA